MVAPAMFSVIVDRDISEHPRLVRVEPQVAGPAEIVTAFGAKLDRSRVAELILSNADRTAITYIVEQRPDLIRFRVPPSLEPGQYQLVLVVESRWGTELIDQDVVLTVVSPEERGAISSRSNSALAEPSALHSQLPRCQ